MSRTLIPLNAEDTDSIELGDEPSQNPTSVSHTLRIRLPSRLQSGTQDRSASRRRLQTCAIALCGALLLSLLLSFASMVTSGEAGMKRSDFVAYYSASHLVVAGHGARLYDFRALGVYETHLVRPLQVRNGVLPYVYPPYFAVTIAPLGALPYTIAYLIWLLVNSALLAVTVAALQRYARLEGRAAVLLWVATLSFLPVSVALLQGQTSIVLLALLTGTVLAASSRRDAPAGAVLAFALIKPPIVLPFLFVFLLRRRWRTLVAFAVSASALALLPAVALGPSTTSGYARTLLLANGWKNQFGYEPALNHSFSGLAQLLLPSPASGLAGGLLCFIALGLLILSALRPVDIVLPLGLAAVVALLISPHVLIHDLSLLLVPVGVALRYRRSGPDLLQLLLGLGYLAVTLGLMLVAFLPLQLSVLAMSALGLWLVLAPAPRAAGHLQRLPPDVHNYP